MKRLKKIFVLSHEWNVFIVLLFIVALSLVSFWTVKVHLEKEWTARLTIEVERTLSAVDQHIQGYDQALNSTTAFFKMNGLPSPQAFKEYVNSSLILKRFPSLQGLAYAQKFSSGKEAQEIQELEQRMRNQGYSDFRVWPQEGREPQSAVILIQPEDWRNQRALGFDMTSESERRDAMARSEKSNSFSMTGAIELLQRDEKDRPLYGFSIYRPIYDEPQMPAKGFVYVIVRSPQFFNGVLGVPDFYEERVNYSVTAKNSSLGRPHLLYERFSLPDSRTLMSDIAIEKTVKVFDQEWTFRFEPLPHFFNWYERYIPIFIAFLTLVMMSVIFLALWSTQQFLKFSEKHQESLAEGSKNKSLEIILFRRLNNMMTDLSSTIESQDLFDKFYDHLRGLFLIEDCVVYVSERQGNYEKRFHKEQHILPQVLNLPKDFDELDFSGCVSLRGEDPLAELFLQSIPAEVHLPLKEGHYYLMRDALHESGRKTSIMLVLQGPEVICETKIKEYALTSIFSQFVMSYEKLILLRRAEDANFMKSSFLANMSHEIRTPLGVIIGYSEILANENLSSEEKVEMVDALKRNGKELARLIDDILDISKVEAGKLHLDMNTVDLEALMEEIRSVMAARAREKGIDFSVVRSAHAPKTIQTDDIRLKQILVNIIGNAIKFTEKGGVKVLYRAVAEEPEKAYLEFQVQDSGIGIAEENQAHLFQAFSQADITTTRKYGGTGLGLALSRRLAELLGGDLFLQESQVNQGSTFCLRIPLASLAQGSHGESSLAPTPVKRNIATAIDAGFNWNSLNISTLLSGVKVLLVEDSEDNQEIFQHFLSTAGAEVVVASDGLQAVEMAFSEKPQVILMDIQIPKIDGKEATRRIRQKGFVAPIVALTAHALQDEVKSCLAAGCVGQITKPVAGEVLVREVYFFLNFKKEKL